MKYWRVGGRGVLACTLAVLSATALASEAVIRTVTAEPSIRLEGGAKVVHVISTDGVSAPSRSLDSGFEAGGATRRTLRIATGQTLAAILHAAGVTRRETAGAVEALGRTTNLRRLQVGQRLTLYLEPAAAAGPPMRLFGLDLDLGRGRSAVVFRDLDGRFSVRRVPAEQAAALLESIVVVDETGEPGLITRELVLRKGQTLNRLLIEAGATSVDGHRAASKMGERVNLRRLRIGQLVTVSFEIGGRAGAARLAGVAMTLGNGRTEVVGRGADGRWRHGRAAVAGSDPTEAAPVSETRTIVLGKDEILFDRIVAAGATRKETDRAVRDLAKALDLRKLQIGEEFRLTFSAPPGAGRAQLTGISVTTDDHQLVVLGWPLAEESTAALPGGASPSIRRIPPQPEAEPREAAGATPARALPPLGHQLRMATIGRGDNLTALLAGAGVPRHDITRALHGLRKVHDPNRLGVGRRLVVELDHTGGAARLARFTLETGRRSAVIVERSGGDRFSARKTRHKAIDEAIGLAEAQAQAGVTGVVEADAAGDAPFALGTDLETRVNGYRLIDLEHGAETAAVTVNRGSTLMKVLVEAGAGRGEAHAAIESVRELYDPRKLRAGQKLALTFVNANPTASPFATGSRQPVLGALSLDLSAETRLEVVRLENGGFVSGFVEKDLVRDVRRVDGVIDSSLYDAAIAAGVPVAVMMEMIRIYSFDVDFQRDLQPGDGFELMYEMLVDERGEEVATGEILYASMTLSGTLKALYRYRLADRRVDYFDALGESMRKALMRTPINGARLSSGFGMRRNPVLAYSKMHKGLDFAAPRGTPIYAAGDGVVERAGRYGAYGKYVRLRHNSEYATAYAHLSRFANGIRSGKRVKQGETIGFVGSTGRSTGPHLHYEILRHGKQVNPLGVKLPTGVKLAGDEHDRFVAERDRLRTLYAELPSLGEVAESGR